MGQSEQKTEVRQALASINAEQNASDYFAALARIANVAERKERDELIGEFVVNKNNAWLRAGNFEPAIALLKGYAELVPQIGHPETMMPGAISGRMANLRESLASDAVVLMVRANRKDLAPIIEQLLPKKISDPVLAYNLACWHAVNNEKAPMLKMIKICVNLGKEESQFLADSDFDAFKNDPDFKAAFQ